MYIEVRFHSAIANSYIFTAKLYYTRRMRCMEESTERTGMNWRFAQAAIGPNTANVRVHDV